MQPSTDQDIILKPLKVEVGLPHVTVGWFTSYLSKRTLSIRIEEYSSTIAPVTYSSIPQSSILGHLLFSLYTLHLGCIFTVPITVMQMTYCCAIPADTGLVQLIKPS